MADWKKTVLYVTNHWEKEGRRGGGQSINTQNASFMHYRFNGFSPKASILKEKQSMKNGRVCCHYPSHKFIDKILGGGRFPSLRRNEFSSGGSFTSKQGWEIVLSSRRCNVEFIEKFLWTCVTFLPSIQLWHNWMNPGSVLPL